MNTQKGYTSNCRKPQSRPPTASSTYMAKVLGIKSVKSSLQPVNSKLAPSKKRSRPAPPEDDEDEELAASRAMYALGGIDSKPPRKKRAPGALPEEKRLRRFRQKPPQSYLERLERATSQRMFLIERNRTTSEDGLHQEETFDIAGSTGNVYQVAITKVPHCSCPDSRKGNHCKHIVYVMVNVLKAPSDLAYQLALLSTELNAIFANAPATKISDSDSSSLSTHTGGTRKPVEGDCPVCVMPFEDGEELVWCKAACGQNIHQSCFQQWQRSKPGQIAKCVFCRSTWVGETKDVGKAAKKGVVNEEGYVNIAGELGISTERDMSTYHPFWVSQQSRNRW